MDMIILFASLLVYSIIGYSIFTNAHRLFTASDQSCLIYFVLSNLLFCKLIHFLHHIFHWCLYQLGHKCLYSPIICLCQKYKVIIELFYLHIIFMYSYYRNSSLIPCFGANINILYTHTQNDYVNVNNFGLFFT